MCRRQDGRGSASEGHRGACDSEGRRGAYGRRDGRGGAFGCLEGHRGPFVRREEERDSVAFAAPSAAVAPTAVVTDDAAGTARSAAGAFGCLEGRRGASS